MPCPYITYHRLFFTKVVATSQTSLLLPTDFDSDLLLCRRMWCGTPSMAPAQCLTAFVPALDGSKAWWTWEKPPGSWTPPLAWCQACPPHLPTPASACTAAPMLSLAHEVPLAQGSRVYHVYIIAVLETHCLSHVVGQIHVHVSSRIWSQGLYIILQRPATAH